MILAPALAVLPGVRHAFFTREGGVSDGIYAGLNCGFGSGDDPLWHSEPGSEGGGDNWGRNRGHGYNKNQSWGSSEQMDHIIEPGQFGRILKTGGPANRNRVSAVWYQAGRRFSSGGNALLAEFGQ